MATTGYRNPTSAYVSFGVANNVSNVLTSNNSYATITALGQIAIRAYDFGFTVPTTATITGCSVKVEGYASGTANILARVNNGGPIAFSVISPLTGSDAQHTVSDTSQLSYYNDVSVVNSSSFFIDIIAENNSGTVFIDNIQVSVTYTCPTPVISTTTLDDGTETVSYSESISGTYLTGTWDISTGSLPTGLAIDGTTGVISGTPTVAGTYNFTVRLTATCGAVVDTQALSILIIDVVAKSFTSTVDGTTGVASAYTKVVSSIPYPVANNNRAYVMNTDNGAWSYINNHPFAHQIYRPDTQDMLGSRRDNTGQLSIVNDGITFDGTVIAPALATGFYDFGKLDEIKSMPDDSSLAMKKLRAFFADYKGTGTIYLDVITENATHTFTLTSTAASTLSALRIALSRDIRGKYVKFRIYSSDAYNNWIGETGVKVAGKNIR